MSLLALHLPKSRTKAIACNTNHHLRGKGERYGAQSRKNVSLGRTMIEALELLQLAKRYILRRSDVEQRRNQACSYSYYQVMFV